LVGGDQGAKVDSNGGDAHWTTVSLTDGALRLRFAKFNAGDAF